MSSHIDYFDCPKCGGDAQREQDNKSGDVFFSCSNCDWNGEDVEDTEIFFECPQCGFKGNGLIECVLTGYHHQTVSKIEEDGSVIYNHIESEGTVDRFQCENCGYVLKNEDGSKIDTEEELIEWLKMDNK
jgi:predicted RNA-binding Zn-ribbon protein involved in translation (DUF1610 family)